MEHLVSSGVSQHKLEKFLDHDPAGTGSVRDQIAADMANDLLAAIGQPRTQTAAIVRRLRARGNWASLDRRPPE